MGDVGLEMDVITALISDKKIVKEADINSVHSFLPKQPKTVFIHDNMAIFASTGKGESTIATHEDDNFYCVLIGHVSPVNRIILSKRNPNPAKAVLEGFMKTGYAFMQEIDMDVYCAIYEKKHGRIFLWGDEGTALRPLFYEKRGRIMSSTMKSVLIFFEQHKIPKAINKSCLQEFLSLGYVIRPETLVQGVKQARPRSYLESTPQGIREIMMPPPQYSSRRVNRAFRTEFMRDIEESVERKLAEVRAPCVGFSGGVDSAALVALMRKQTDRKISTIFVTFQDDSQEERDAERLAREFDTQHYVRRVKYSTYLQSPLLNWYYDAPASNYESIPYFELANEAAKHGRSLFLGAGCDTPYGSYTYGIVKKMIAGRAFKKQFLPTFYLSQYRRADDAMCEHLTGQCPDWKKTIDKAETFDMKRGSIINRAIQLDTDLFGSHRETYTIARCICNAHSLRLLTPFKALRILEKVNSLPWYWKTRIGIRKTEKKYFFKKIIAEKLLPPDIVYKPKRWMSAPIGDWFEHELHPVVQDVFKDLRKSPEINAEFATQILEKHRQGQRRSFMINTLFHYALWKRLFIEGEIEPAAKVASRGIQ